MTHVISTARPMNGQMNGFLRFMFFLVVFSCMFTIFVSVAHAQPIPPAGVNVLGSSSRQLNGNPVAVPAMGGNVTEIFIQAITTTKAWQGYYGNVTGNILLDDANNNSFYSWGNATALSGKVFASRNSTVQWQNIRCINSSEVLSENTYLGLSPADGDSVGNTFGKLSHPSFYVGLTQIINNTCPSTNAYVNGSSQNATFYQILLSDNTSNTVYSTILENKQYAYNGQRADFQLMVGENEHIGFAGPTNYYFFVELS